MPTDETEDLEEKSQFTGQDREWLRLVKTVTAMANTRGGKLLIVKSDLKPEDFDSSRIDSRVHKYVAPHIDDLRVERTVDVGGVVHAVVISIPESHAKPHIMVEEGQYSDQSGNHRREFYPGQIWVRHSASNSPAGPDDIDSILRSRAAGLLRQLGTVVLQTPLSAIEATAAAGGGLVFRVTDDPDAAPVNFVYPYTATSLGQTLSTNQLWVAKAADVLGWRLPDEYDPKFMQAIPSAKGDYIQQWRYSEAARAELERVLSEQPDFDPFSPSE